MKSKFFTESKKFLKTHEQTQGTTFKEWLVNKPQEIKTTLIQCSYSNLIDLNGIEEFKNLEVLLCQDNQLTELPDLSQLKNLQYLYCQNNQLTKLPDLSELENLEELYCHNNKLTKLPDLTGLKVLWCYNNKLTKLPDLTGLKDLWCYNNNLPFYCTELENNLEEYLEWQKKTYPWIWDAKTYNL